MSSPCRRDGCVIPCWKTTIWGHVCSGRKQNFDPAFGGVEGFRVSNATCHGIHEVLMNTPPCMAYGGRPCTAIEPCGALEISVPAAS